MEDRHEEQKDPGWPDFEVVRTGSVPSNGPMWPVLVREVSPAWESLFLEGSRYS